MVAIFHLTIVRIIFMISDTKLLRQNLNFQKIAGNYNPSKVDVSNIETEYIFS